MCSGRTSSQPVPSQARREGTGPLSLPRACKHSLLLPTRNGTAAAQGGPDKELKAVLSQAPRGLCRDYPELGRAWPGSAGATEPGSARGEAH